MEADGLLLIHGRDGDTLNLDGRKIELGPIEQAVGEMADVTDCCALCVRTDRGDRLAIVVSCPDNTDLEALARSIRHTIPSLHRFTLVHLPQIPRNAMGKVPRLALGRRIEQTSAFRAKNGV
jgi:acyl-coenzyme A synthetase/AMP-(fatty) acid ligase